MLADEPSTALDVTIRAQILDLLVRLQEDKGMALVLVTHDMGVVAETARSVAVMYAGQVVEQRDVEGRFETPSHPYTAALLDALIAEVPAAFGADGPARAAERSRLLAAPAP